MRTALIKAVLLLYSGLLTAYICLHPGDFPQRKEIASSQIELTASSTTPTLEDRVGQLWIGNSQNAPTMRCTANHLDGRFWLTAAHCLKGSDANIPVGFIRQTDGENAKLEKIHLGHNGHDVALLEVSEGINAEPFHLPDRPLALGEQATLVGYGGSHKYPSLAPLAATRYHFAFRVGESLFTNVIETQAVTDSWSCNGDSGGAVYVGETLYAIHLAGGQNPGCLGKIGGKSWESDIYPLVEWIKQTINDSEGMGQNERLPIT